MQYQSIIRILEYCGIDCIALDVAKAKKILAAEFSIAPGGIISIDGFDYTQNDVFNELECDDFASRLPTHLWIWKTPSLLNCLEKNEANIKELQWLNTTHFNDKSYRQAIRVISPYFAVSFNKIMHKLLNEAQFTVAEDWIQTLRFVDNAEDEYTALSSTRIFINDFIRLLRNSNERSYKSNLPQLNKWFSQPWYNFTNQLPESLDSTVNDLLLMMNNFTVAIYSTNKRLCRKISKQLIQVENIDSDSKKAITENHEAFKPLIYIFFEGLKGYRISGWEYFFLGWIILKIIGYIFKSCS